MTGRIYYSDFVEGDLEEIWSYIVESNEEAASNTIMQYSTDSDYSSATI